MASSKTTTFCAICSKDFGDRKRYTDHRRMSHAPVYLTGLDGTHLLAREKPRNAFMCHLCRHPCGKVPSTVKSHYQDKHKLAVSVSINDPTSGSSRETPSSQPSSSSEPFPLALSPLTVTSEDSEMEEADVENDQPVLTAPSFSLGAREDFVDRGFDGDDDDDDYGDNYGDYNDDDNDGDYEEWDTDSELSDTEVLVDEDCDDVVPRSFDLDLSTPVNPLSDDGSPGSDEQLPQPLLKSKEEQSPPSARVFRSDRLRYDKPLCEFGYGLNEEVKAIICIGCHRGVPTDMLQTHSKSHHRGRCVLSSEQHAQVVQHLSGIGYRASNAEKYDQPPDQKPVDGLEVLSGFRCPLLKDDGTPCSKAFLAQSTFTRHLSDHSDNPKPKPPTCISDVQTLFSQGGLQRYFAVDQSLSIADLSSTSAYAYAVKMLKSLPEAHIPPPDHDKDRASIHWFTRWPELLRPYIADKRSQTSLQSLVSFPDPNSDPEWLLKLLDHGSRWWNAAELAHKKCSYRASVMLKSHQMHLGAWRMLRESESARRYCGTAISLVSFSLRAFTLPSDKVPTRFTDMQQATLREYQEYLMGDLTPSDTDLEKFQAALSSVLFRDRGVDIDTVGRLACPVQSFISLLSLRKTGEFVKPGLVTQPISRFIYLSRAVVLRIALRDYKDKEIFLRNLKSLCARYLGTGEGKISDELISLKRYASSLAMREPGDPHTLYDPNYTALAYRGRRLVLQRFQTGLSELIVDTWSRLLALTGNTKVEVQVPSFMSEDLRSTDIGDSFIRRVTTNPPTLPLLFEMSKHSGLSLLRLGGRSVDEPAFVVDPGAAQEFFHATKPIVKSIAFLLQVTGSGPLRLTEVVDDRHCNGSSPRNVFISHGLLFLLRRNLKPSSARGCRSSVVHFPPERVAELLTYYLAVIRPVEIFLTAGLGWAEQQAAYSEFLYVVKGRKLSPQQLSWIIAQHTERYFSCRLTGLDLRHVLINLQSVFLPPIVDPSVQKFGDSQAGHTTRIANHVYGQRLDHLPGEQAALFVLAYHWCQKLHTFLGLGPESTPVRPIPYIHAPPQPTWWSPSDYIPPHPPSNHQIMAQVNVIVNAALSKAAQELATRCEDVIKQTVFQAIGALSAVTGPFSAQPFPPVLDNLRVQRNPESDVSLPTPISAVTLEDDELQRILSLYTQRPGSVFSCDNQRRLLDAVLTGKHDSIIAILPTGSGKSIAIFAPVLAESTGISVVVTCYTALRRQLAGQARSLGIEHLVWSDRNDPDSPDRMSVRLVIMITDDMFTDDARLFIINSAVVRIVVDEAHSTFLSTSYRPKMEALVHLRQAPVPKTFLTATLVPSHEKILADYVGVSLERTLVLRSPTARPNHRLQLAAIPRSQDPSTVGIRLASLLLEKWVNDRAVRGIVFVRSLKRLDSVSSDLPFPVCTYHGKMSLDEKDGQLNSWLSDEHPAKWMISTTALLHGVDYPRVDAVIFLESPFGLYDFVQGAGRAGRSGQESFITVLHNKTPPVLPDENPHACRAEIERVLSASTCRRVCISEAMDGSAVSCSELPNSLPCDLCEGRVSPLIAAAMDASTSAPIQVDTVMSDSVPRLPPRPPPTALLTGFSAQTNAAARKKHAETVKDAMERFSGCFVCRIGHDDHRPCHEKCGSSRASGCEIASHVPFQCGKFPHKIGWMAWKKIHFAWPRDVSRCYYCGLPNAVAGFLHKTKEGNYPGVCQFSDTAVTAAWHILHSPPLFTKLQKELGFVPGVDQKATFAVWLTQYGSPSEDIRLLSVFMWLCRQYYPNFFNSG